MSDLREALKPFVWNSVSAYEACNGTLWHTAEEAADESGRAWAALSAQPQPEAVGPFSPISAKWVVARDGIEAQHGLNDVFPGDPYPASTLPIAPDERLRKALELWLDVEIAYASDMQREMYRSGKDRLGDNYHGRHTALLEVKQKVEALSRADEGKESEGGADPVEEHLTERNRRDTLARAGIPSDPTPAEQREAVAQWPDGCRNPNSCSIHRDCMYLQCKHYTRDISGEVDVALQRGGA